MPRAANPCLLGSPSIPVATFNCAASQQPSLTDQNQISRSNTLSTPSYLNHNDKRWSGGSCRQERKSIAPAITTPRSTRVARMPLVDMTNAGQRPAHSFSAKKSGGVMVSPMSVNVEANHEAEVAPYMRDPTFGLGDAIIATPALFMHQPTALEEEGGVCISAAPKPCVLEADGSGTSVNCNGSSYHFRLGMCYLQGKGVAQDSVRAVECFTKASEAGDSNAQFNLAVCYAQGLGCTRDEDKAFYYFVRAADQGDPKAQLQVGVCHIVGRGTPLNEAQAAVSFRLAADAGDATAQYNLGVCLGKGRGMTKDLAEAAVWYRKSAEQSDPMAQFRLALCYATGKGLDKSPVDAVEWYLQAAKAQHGGALFNLGVCHAQGDGVVRDDSKAVDFYRKAATLGVVQAQHNLALCLLTGVGTDKDMMQAVAWYLKAANQGDAKAQFAAGVCFEIGQGAEKNVARAAELYIAASEQGNVKAIVALGLCYKSGAGVVQDEDKAFQLFEAAAHKGNHRGMYQLGCHLVDAAQQDSAMHWFKAAAAKGNNDAAETIKRLADPEYAAKCEARRASRIEASRIASSCTFESTIADKEPNTPAQQSPIDNYVADKERRRSGGSERSISKDSFADLTTTSNMLDRSADAASTVFTSTVMIVQELSALPVSHADEQVFAVNPDKRFSCPGMDSSFGLSSSQFDVPGRQSMVPWHHKTNQKMP